jgi:hypothetical protein
MAAATSRYRRAWQAGQAGRSLPGGLADLADDDPKIDSAYQAGQANESFEGWLGDNDLSSNPPSGSGSSGSSSGSDGGRPGNRRRGSRRSSSGGRSDAAKGFARSPAGAVAAPAQQVVGSSTEEGAGFLLGLVVYALILSVVDYGTKGPLMWLNAKFRNKVTTAASPAPNPNIQIGPPQPEFGPQLPS